MIFLSSVKQKVYDWKDRLRDRHMLTLVVGLIVIIVALGLYIYKKQMEYFIDCVNEKKATFNTIKDAYNVLKIGLEQ